MDENIREYQKAVRFLCDEIRGGIINVGDRIPTERSIAQELNISRNSTREAIRSLENMGIIESHRGSGNYYTGNVSRHLTDMINTLLSIKHISYIDISNFRRIMDKSVCMTIINSDSFDLSTAYEILDRVPSSLDDEIKNDTDFHFQLNLACGNKLWSELMSAIVYVYENLIRLIIENSDTENRAEFKDIHRCILDSISKKDWEACEKAIDRHYDAVKKELLTLSPQDENIQ